MSSAEVFYDTCMQLIALLLQLKMKVQKLRDTRDYSFLMSDDAEFPVPSKECAPRNVPVRTSGTLNRFHIFIKLNGIRYT